MKSICVLLTIELYNGKCMRLDPGGVVAGSGGEYSNVPLEK